MRRFDLRSLHFGEASEIWRRLPVEVAPFVFGGLDYEAEGDAVDLHLTAARVGDHLTLTAEFTTEVTGPCQRCLGEASVPVQARGIEYVRHGESGDVGDDEEEGYAAAFVLDVERWVRDLIAGALPAKILCRDDCLGLCPVCGVDLNTQPEHGHAEA
jgi:DUF177 domain-containing protein